MIHMGDNSKGLAAKLAQNMNIAFIYEGLCESLTLAKEAGREAGKNVRADQRVHDPFRCGRI